MKRRQLALMSLLALSSGSFGAEFFEVASHDSPYVRGVSADGQTVIGFGDGQAWRWTRESGRIFIPEVTPGGHEVASGVSADGSIVVGYAFDSSGNRNAFRWTEESGTIQIVADGQITDSFARDISDDGVITVRGRFPEDDFHTAFQWTEEGGLEVLEALRDVHVWNTPLISDDGNVLAGTLEPSRSGFVWNARDGMIDIGALPGKDGSRVWGVSADGSVIVGQSGNDLTSDRGSEAFYWTQETGMVGLGYLPGRRGGSLARDVTADGRIVVGTSESGNANTPSRAFVWDAEHGMRELQKVLETDHGLSDLPYLTEVMEISDDQKTIVGQTPLGDFARGTAWAIYLDKPLVKPLGDFDDDHYRNAVDIDVLSQAVLSANMQTAFDLNTDGSVDEDDRVYWVEEAAKSFFGDANLDQKVDFADFLSLSDAFGQNGGWADGDFTGDGQVLFDDFLLLSSNFGQTMPASSSLASVPEPAGSVLACLALLVSFQGRRRRTTTHRAAEDWSDR